MSNQSGVYVDALYTSLTSGLAKASFTSEFKINDTTTMGPTPVILPQFFMPNSGIGRGLHIVARGIVSSTATPTYTFTCRLGVEGSTTAAIALGSAAITMQSGVTNTFWDFDGHIVFKSFGAAGANSTMTGVGRIIGAGFASPFIYPLWAAGATPGTVAIVDHSIANYCNFNVTCSASSASNTITIQQLIIEGY